MRSRESECARNWGLFCERSEKICGAFYSASSGRAFAHACFTTMRSAARKGPLARVWLAAHWERKLSKQQFLQTSIRATVHSIVGPEQPPMALRLSGQLLLGDRLPQIYSRKCKYLLEDCGDILLKLKLAFKANRVDVDQTAMAMRDGGAAAAAAITLPDVATEFDLFLPMPDLSMQCVIYPMPFCVDTRTPLDLCRISYGKRAQERATTPTLIARTERHYAAAVASECPRSLLRLPRAVVGIHVLLRLAGCHSRGGRWTRRTAATV